MALAVLLVTSVEILPMFVPQMGNASPAPSSTVPPAYATMVVGAPSEATPISPAFWGINVAVQQRFDDVDGQAVATTPVNYVRFPGGQLGEEYNYTSSVLTADNGTQSVTTTSTAEFVAACEQFNCHAILQLPAEINDTATAAYYASYVVNSLHFQPAYWEIGNDPSGWDHYNVPWSQWKGNQGGNTTPLPFANEVHAYIQAVLAVDPFAQFIALGAGMGGKNYDKSWVEELASVDGHELAGISVHSYIEGGPANPTDAGLFANLRGVYSLPDQVTADRAYIQAGCPSCANLNLFVTEINAAEVSSYNSLLPTFAGTLYLAAETVQGLSLQVTNLDWFAYDSHFSGSWSTGPLKWQMQYYLFSDLLTQLENETLPTNMSGPSTFYGMATYGHSQIALLLVNVNTTTPVQLNLSKTGLSPLAALTQYLWTNGTSLPVESNLPADDLPVLPPMSAEVLVGPSVTHPSTYPVTFTETGLPPGGNWSVTLNGTTHSSTSAKIDFTERNGKYSFAVTSPAGYLAAPDNGSVSVSGASASVPIAFTSTSVSVPEFAATFVETGLPAGTLWSVELNGSASASSTNTVAFWETNGSYEFLIGGVPGFSPNPNSGSILVAGAAVNVSLSYVTASSSYAATFSETGLASGDSWTVLIGGANGTATAPSPVVVSLPNGTFAFTVDPVSGYSVTPATGWATLDEAGTTVAVTYALSPTPPSNPLRIHAVEGGVLDSNGSEIPNIGVTLVFSGGTPPVEWLNLTTDSSGRFSASGLNLSGNLSAANIDSPSYQVKLTRMTWGSADAVNVTVVLQRVAPGSPPFKFVMPSVLDLVTLGLAVTAIVLVGALVQAARRDRRLSRYREYFASASDKI